MNREDHLDHLIEQRLHGRFSPVPENDDDSARIGAAEALAQLNEIEVPPDMAARIEARIRAKARAHRNGRIVMIEGGPRPSADARRPLYRRPWMIALTAAAVVVLACVGVLRAASASLPGDFLYGVKQFEQQIALTTTNNPADRARLQISNLQGDISDLEAEVSQGRSDDDITQALSVVATETRDSQAAVASLPAGAERDAIQQSLEETLGNERATLYQLLPSVDWSMRLAFTQQLGVLGAPVPTITQVTAVEGSNDAWTVRLTGTNFASGAHVLINGTPRGTVRQNTSTELVVEVNGSDWPGGTYTVGVLNPDGTAAQITQKGDDQHGGSNDGDDHGGQGTPGPGSTPGSGDDHDGDDGSGEPGGSGGSSSGSGSGDDGSSH